MMRRKRKEKGGKGSEQDNLLEVAHEKIKRNGFIYLPFFTSCQTEETKILKHFFRHILFDQRAHVY
jgi:hypothetical protein